MEKKKIDFTRFKVLRIHFRKPFSMIGLIVDHIVWASQHKIAFYLLDLIMGSKTLKTLKKFYDFSAVKNRENVFA